MNIPDDNNTNEKKEQQINYSQKAKGIAGGCLATIIITIIFIIIAIIIWFTVMKATDNPILDDLNTGNVPKIFTRSATLNDITITGDDFDLSSFGEKLTFNPKTDIDDLAFTFTFQRSNGTVIKTIVKNVGNVKEGKQYSITIGLTDILSWDIISNINDIQCRYRVSSGTVSYFS